MTVGVDGFSVGRCVVVGVVVVNFVNLFVVNLEFSALSCVFGRFVIKSLLSMLSDENDEIFVLTFSGLLVGFVSSVSVCLYAFLLSDDFGVLLKTKLASVVNELSVVRMVLEVSSFPKSMLFLMGMVVVVVMKLNVCVFG